MRPLAARAQQAQALRSLRLRSFAAIGIQSGLAAAIAWIIARYVLNNPDPVFAPAVAVSAIASSIGQRVRRTAQLIGGVVIGIAIGDLLIELVGTGAWQIGGIVAVAVIVAMVLDGSSTLMTQAGGTAVLIVALTPLKPDLEVPRFVNAAVGGAVGLVVYLVLFPLHPLRLIERQARPVFDLFATELAAAAAAMSAQDLSGVESALDRLRHAQPALRSTRDAVQTAMEVATLAPVRRHSRPVLVAYSAGFEHLERALRNSRGNLRRMADMIREEEPVPVTLPSLVQRLGDTARTINRDLLAGRVTEPMQSAARDIAVSAQRALADRPGPNGTIAVAALHTIVFDLLRASGADRSQARKLIRDARRSAARE